ncbi:hypothetical protein BGW80DRAFT_588350 [Lactifluus volemus]|nr:hypothetical protein BGW80DRAFT_588350 [Lactifluus volemus]
MPVDDRSHVAAAESMAKDGADLYPGLDWRPPSSSSSSSQSSLHYEPLFHTSTHTYIYKIFVPIQVNTPAPSKSSGHQRHVMPNTGTYRTNSHEYGMYSPARWTFLACVISSPNDNQQNRHYTPGNDRLTDSRQVGNIQDLARETLHGSIRSCFILHDAILPWPHERK